MFLIKPTNEEILQGLESWSWLPVNDKQPIAVTAFGDVFFDSDDGVWFLDTLEGSLTLATKSKDELQKLLNTEEGQDHYLMSGFILRTHNEGMTLGPGQCYEFKVHPIIGGEIEFDNIEIQDFVVSLNLCGQLHEQIKDLPSGTKINEFKFVE